jgi:hypothetical protein
VSDFVCAGCGRHDDEIAPLVGHIDDAPAGEFCYDCWHARREATPPYYLYSDEERAFYGHCTWLHLVLTRLEAERFATTLNARPYHGPDDFLKRDFQPMLACSWDGDRLSHNAAASARSHRKPTRTK